MFSCFLSKLPLLVKICCVRHLFPDNDNLPLWNQKFSFGLQTGCKCRRCLCTLRLLTMKQILKSFTYAIMFFVQNDFYQINTANISQEKSTTKGLKAQRRLLVGMWELNPTPSQTHTAGCLSSQCFTQEMPCTLKYFQGSLMDFHCFYAKTRLLLYSFLTLSHTGPAGQQVNRRGVYFLPCAYFLFLSHFSTRTGCLRQRDSVSHEPGWLKITVREMYNSHQTLWEGLEL